MTNKEIGELRRRMKPDRTNLTAVYGCYVASSGEVLSTFREPFGLMAEEDKEKYLALLKKVLACARRRWTTRKRGRSCSRPSSAQSTLKKTF